jgi:TonB family protein
MRCSNCGNELRPGTKFCTTCGTLAAQPTAPTPTPQPTVSFGDAPRAQMSGAGMAQPPRKSGCGKVLLVLGIVGLVGVVGLALAGYFGFRYARDQIKSSEAYSVAITALKQHPEAVERLGTIKETGFPIGSFKEDANGTGAAAYKVSVTGTKASGDYVVVLRREHSKWRLVTGRLTLNDGDTIIIKEPGAGESEDASDATGDDEGIPPPPAPPGKPGQTTTGTVISGGILNDKATSKPAPAYPPIAKTAKASGTVVVEVVVDEKGQVETARAVSGHPLLQQAAIAAAKQARFKPALQGGKPVKVRGMLTYNFELQ